MSALPGIEWSAIENLDDVFALWRSWMIKVVECTQLFESGFQSCLQWPSSSVLFEKNGPCDERGTVYSTYIQLRSDKNMPFCHKMFTKLNLMEIYDNASYLEQNLDFWKDPISGKNIVVTKKYYDMIDYLRGRWCLSKFDRTDNQESHLYIVKKSSIKLSNPNDLVVASLNSQWLEWWQ